MIYNVNRCPLRIWARSTSRISRQALFTSGIKSEKYTCLPSLRVPTMPAAFKIATCCDRLALEIPSSVWSSEATQSRLPRQSSIRRRVELAKDLQIRACRSKISESGLGRFLFVLATDSLWSPGGQLNSQEQGKIISGPRRLLVPEFPLMFSLCLLNCSRKARRENSAIPSQGIKTFVL